MPQSIVSRQWTVIFQLLLIAIPHETTISFASDKIQSNLYLVIKLSKDFLFGVKNWVEWMI